MFQIKELKKSYGGRVLFNGCSLNLNIKERVALIGANGTGKTTLFRMIAGTESYDSGSGSIIIEKGSTVGFLPQEIDVIRGLTVLNEVMLYSDEINKVKTKIEEIETELSMPNQNNHDVLLNEYSKLRERFDELGGYEYEHKAKIILLGLGFKESDYLRATDEFSGGWMMRIALAKLLLKMPDLILLDEPTNHLDLKTLLWFQEYLLSCNVTMIFTSHDIDFINHVATRVVDIDNGILVSYSGNYDYYIEEKNMKKEILMATLKNQEKQIKKATVFIDRFRAKASKAKSVQSKIRAIEKMEVITIEKERKHIHFQFPQPVRSGKEVMILKNINKNYGNHIVYQNVNLNIIRGNKFALVGSNGAGKSTLLKILAGVLGIDSGERIVGYDVSIGYYPQHRLDILNADATCLKNIEEVSISNSQTEIRKLLGKFLFSGDAVYKKVSVLSGGEKSRLVMAKILSNPPNLLLMDEPTNHLDIPSRNVLIEAISGYSGTLCFISHDVYFIRAIANGVIEVENKELKIYPDGYDYYLHKKKLESKDEQKIPLKSYTKEKTKHIAILPKNKKNIQDDKIVEINKKIKETEKDINESTFRFEELNKILADPGTYESNKFIDLVKEHKLLEDRIKTLTKDWGKYVEELENNS
ncbi:MAG: ABC-F family ATP-binding cassette domain-containing protein [Candidatus Firestonebacteria bacterium]